MKINCGGIDFKEIADFKTMSASIEADLNRLGVLVNVLENLDVRTVAATEGILTDVVSTTYKTLKGSAKMGAKGYKALNKKSTDGKNRWKTYLKPLLIKTIKEMGSILQNVYIKYSKLDERYANLGKKIKEITGNRMKQLGVLPDGVKIRVHDFEDRVMKGYITIMEDYKEFYDGVLKRLAPDFIEPKVMASMIDKGELNEVGKSAKSVSEAIREINQYGDISIPWAVFKNERYAAWFKGLFKRKPNKNELKSSLSDYVKNSILSEEVEYAFSVNDRQKFINVCGTFLESMGSILNSNVIDKSLKVGGNSIKATTKSLFNELDVVSKAMDKVAVRRRAEEMKEANKNSKNKAKPEEDEENKEGNESVILPGNNNNFIDNPNLKEEEEHMLEKDKKEVGRARQPKKGVDFENMKHAEVVEDEPEEKSGNDNTKDEETKFTGEDKDDVVGMYVQNMCTLISKTSTAYTGVVRGTLSALLILVQEAEQIIGVLETSVPGNKERDE